ncbi:MAG: hypothetical protein ACUVRZ_09450 [Desulfobacca sp.]|uniref:hypothetical protein n=1 Tax=Desulfobacca sp. TaxID=2067990 RepID=UPI00404A1397
MSAVIMEPTPRQYVIFPLVVHWQPWLENLSLYLPDLHGGLVSGAPAAARLSLLQPPRQQVWQAFARHFRPGELRQWQAYLHYLGAQEDQDEQDLRAAIRGTLAPVLPPELDREVLWSLAYQLEETLAEKAAGLERLAAQEKALGQLLGEAEPDAPENLPVDVAFSPALTRSTMDLSLARLRLQFWQKILAPYLEDPWTLVVLEPMAGDSSPRYLWQAAQAEGQEVWQTAWQLPGWRPQPGCEAQAMAPLELGVVFRKTLAGLLQALSLTDAAAAAAWQEQMNRLVEERCWPAATPHQATAIRLEVVSRLAARADAPSLPSPMVFLSPGD